MKTPGKLLGHQLFQWSYFGFCFEKNKHAQIQMFKNNMNAKNKMLKQNDYRK